METQIKKAFILKNEMPLVSKGAEYTILVLRQPQFP